MENKNFLYGATMVLAVLSGVLVYNNVNQFISNQKAAVAASRPTPRAVQAKPVTAPTVTSDQRIQCVDDAASKYNGCLVAAANNVSTDQRACDDAKTTSIDRLGPTPCWVNGGVWMSRACDSYNAAIKNINTRYAQCSANVVSTFYGRRRDCLLDFSEDIAACVNSMSASN